MVILLQPVFGQFSPLDLPPPPPPHSPQTPPLMTPLPPLISSPPGKTSPPHPSRTKVSSSCWCSPPTATMRPRNKMSSEKRSLEPKISREIRVLVCPPQACQSSTRASTSPSPTVFTRRTPPYSCTF